MAKVKRKLDDTEEFSQEDLENIEEEYSSDKSKIVNKIIGGIIIVLIFILLFIGYFVLKTPGKANISSSSEEKISETENPETDISDDDSKESNNSILSQYRLQAVHTKIINFLNDKYGANGYTKPSIDQYQISGTENKPIIDFSLNIGGMNEANKTVPCEFVFNWDNSKQVFELEKYTIDEENSEKSDFVSHSDEEDIKNQTENTNMIGKKVSNYNIKVNSSVTVNITSTGSGNVTAYAISSDGTTTELGSANNNTISNTVSLPSGDYQLVLYAEDGVGYKWNYHIN